jgi:hypothetical protein
MKHKHPTPLKIQSCVMQQLCLAATITHIPSSAMSAFINSLNEGIAQANREHDALKEAME